MYTKTIVKKKKRGHLPYRRFGRGKAVVLTAMLVLAGVGVFRSVSSGAVATAVLPSKQVRVIVDAGHGGVDGGAVGIHGEVEKDINLKIARQVKVLLEFHGIEVIMTRETDTDLSDKNASSIRNKKSTDIKNRLKLIEKYPDALTISIHQNKFTQSKYSGAQMFYGVKHPESQMLAETIQSSIIQKLQPENTRQIKEGTKSVYLLMHTESPIVLVECGFLSNDAEAAKLSTEAYQKEMAFAIFAGMMEYIENGGGSAESSAS